MNPMSDMNNELDQARDMTLRTIPILVEGAVKALEIMGEYAEENNPEKIKEGAVKVQQAIFILKGIIMSLSRDLGLEIFSAEEVLEHLVHVIELAEGNPSNIFKV